MRLVAMRHKWAAAVVWTAILCCQNVAASDDLPEILPVGKPPPDWSPYSGYIARKGRSPVDATVGGGAVFARGTVGWYGRVGVKLTENGSGPNGVVFGSQFGHAPGLTELPLLYFAYVIGAAAGPVDFTVEPGLDFWIIDRVDGSYGLGVVAPRAQFGMLANTPLFAIGVEAGVAYHWEWLVNDFAQFTLGLRLQETRTRD